MLGQIIFSIIKIAFGLAVGWAIVTIIEEKE